MSSSLRSFGWPCIPWPMSKRCKDCEAEGITTKRKIYRAGRCYTHDRFFRRQQKDRAHDLYLQKTYNITAADYWALYEFQGRKCYMCTATGKARRLAVDHDHSCCNGPVSCGQCVRGLLCSQCNKLIGRFRDSPEAFEQAAMYLRNPPAKIFFASLVNKSQKG